MTPLLVLTTAGTAFDVAALARELVEERLAACVNIIPRIESVYRWQGRIETDSEQLLLIKTTRERLDALRARLMARHPYEVPEFVVIEPDEVGEPYRAWLVESLQ